MPTEFDRPIETVREWSYRGRQCRVVRHDMGHYCGYVAFDDADRQAGYYVEREGLHGPALDEEGYYPPGGLTWTTAEETGFDCGHAFDVCIDAEGEPWGPVGRRNYEFYLERYEDSGGDLDLDDLASLPARVWTPDGVVAAVENLADRLPDRSTDTDTDE